MSREAPQAGRSIVDRSAATADVNAGQTALQRETLIRAHQAARQFASGDGPAHWVVFSGPRGCGKTHLAAGIEMEWLRQGSESFHAFVPSLLDHLRRMYAPGSTITYDDLFDHVDHVKSVPLLVLDDLGTESQTPWTDEKLYQIVVHRHDHRLPTVITTAFTLEELEEMNPRVASPWWTRVWLITRCCWALTTGLSSGQAEVVAHIPEGLFLTGPGI